MLSQQPVFLPLLNHEVLSDKEHILFISTAPAPSTGPGSQKESIHAANCMRTTVCETAAVCQALYSALYSVSFNPTLTPSKG